MKTSSADSIDAVAISERAKQQIRSNIKEPSKATGTQLS